MTSAQPTNSPVSIKCPLCGDVLIKIYADSDVQCLCSKCQKGRNTMTKEEIIEELEALRKAFDIGTFDAWLTFKSGGSSYHEGLSDGYDIAGQRISELLAKAKAAPEETALPE